MRAQDSRRLLFFCLCLQTVPWGEASVELSEESHRWLVSVGAKRAHPLKLNLSPLATLQSWGSQWVTGLSKLGFVTEDDSPVRQTDRPIISLRRGREEEHTVGTHTVGLVSCGRGCLPTALLCTALTRSCTGHTIASYCTFHTHSFHTLELNFTLKWNTNKFLPLEL